GRWPREDPMDSLGERLIRPVFLGVQSLGECLFYGKPGGHDQGSLYAAVVKGRNSLEGVHLYTKSPVRRVRFLGDGSPAVRVISDRRDRDYDAVIITAPPSSLAVGTPFDNFSPKQVPWEVRDAMNSSHFITSCKV